VFTDFYPFQNTDKNMVPMNKAINFLIQTLHWLVMQTTPIHP